MMIRFTKYLRAVFSLILVSEGQAECQKMPEKIKSSINDLYTANPSAHVLNGKIYIYPSHDVEADVPQDDEGGHFQMRDYHVFSMDKIGGKVTDHGVALDVPIKNQQAKQMDEGCDAILRKTDLIAPGEEGLRDIRVVEAIYKSASAGKIIKI